MIQVANGLTASINQHLRQRGASEESQLSEIRGGEVEGLPAALDRIIYVITLDAEPSALTGKAGDFLDTVKQAIHNIAVAGASKFESFQPLTLGDVLAHYPRQDIASITAWYFSLEKSKRRRHTFFNLKSPGKGIIS